jgi:serine/threonine protein kinase
MLGLMPKFQQWADEPSEPEISVSAVFRAHTEDITDSSVSGERFGKYLLVGELAVGGMAEVLLAVHKGLEGFVKVVVIKRVLPHYTSNADYIRMFVDEARLAARLEHPNIVRTYEFGEVDGQYFTAMEYLPGEDLSKTLNRLSISRQTMPFHIAAGIVSNLCAGLQFAHQLTDTAGRPLNLVHRDINPQNILLTYGGEVKIIDFGVAKTNTNAQTMAGTIKGKVAYMSPEQILARGVDQRSDVFSAGVVLWEVLTGRPLFMRDSEAATLYAIMNDPIPLPSRYRPDVPRALDAIVERALARTPADRFESAEEMGMAIDSFMPQLPKYDARVLAATVEELFGTTRANAKRAIAQTRSLASNISLVMKLRTGVRTDLADSLSSIAEAEIEAEAAAAVAAEIEAPVVERAPLRKLVVVLAALIVAGIGAGLYYVYTTSSARAPESKQIVQATVEVTSTPPGAAVFVDGEPTGLKTPATLSAITASRLSIRLELQNHRSVTETIEVPTGATIAKSFTLGVDSGRLAIFDLPANATVLVDGNEQAAGEVITLATGSHEVRVVVGGRTVAKQTVEIVPGHQGWKLAGTKLVTTGSP